MRIEKTVKEKDALMSLGDDTETNNLDEAIGAKIDDEAKKLFIVARDIEIKPKDPEYNKLISQNTLTMLNEIECILNDYLLFFEESK